MAAVLRGRRSARRRPSNERRDMRDNDEVGQETKRRALENDIQHIECEKRSVAVGEKVSRPK